MHLTVVGDVLATFLEDALTQYTLEDIHDYYRADTGALIQANQSACNNGPIRLPKQVGFG